MDLLLDGITTVEQHNELTARLPACAKCSRLPAGVVERLKAELDKPDVYSWHTKIKWPTFGPLFNC